MTNPRSPLPIRWLIAPSLVGAIVASTGAHGAPDARSSSTATQRCGSHDLRAYSLIEELGEKGAAPTAWLANASFSLLKARELCHSGDADKAITLYRRIIDGDMSLSDEAASK